MNWLLPLINDNAIKSFMLNNEDVRMVIQKWTYYILSFMIMLFNKS